MSVWLLVAEGCTPIFLGSFLEDMVAEGTASKNGLRCYCYPQEELGFSSLREKSILQSQGFFLSSGVSALGALLLGDRK